MKKRALALISAAVTLITAFSGCNFEIITEETTLPDVITEGHLDNETTYYSLETEAREETTAAAETTSEEITTQDLNTEAEEETTEEQGEIIGYTEKGFVITKKDGITYVDGVLVANKTYSLPEDYNPGSLLPECEKAFFEMKSAAAKEGLNLWNASGFRSYELQSRLYKRYSERDGKEAADRYSARPGHSEHQTGLAIDLNTITSAFANTKEGKWVAENCHKYGFILRYPKEKEAQTGYMYEAWHIRYVGIETAGKIYNSGLCLEEYYGITSCYEDTAENEEPVASVTEAQQMTSAAADIPQEQPTETAAAVQVG
ncbi:MAG: M15 family metallopeptidase [Clostridia bacterium]|nr:M15 family metallopeptidase [Clostridia bacterium]